MLDRLAGAPECAGSSIGTQVVDQVAGALLVDQVEGTQVLDKVTKIQVVYHCYCDLRVDATYLVSEHPS